MTQTTETDVLVVGAGPAGMLAALVLARQGIKTQIFDEEWRTTGRSYALALHPSTLALLAELGLDRDLVAHGQRVERIGIHVGHRREHTLELSQLGGDFPFVLVLPQQALEDALEAELEKTGVNVHWSHRGDDLVLGSEGCRATIDKLSKQSGGYGVAASNWLVEKSFGIQARYVVGTDGYRSTVRRALGGEFPEVQPADVFAVFEYASAGEPRHDMTLVVDDAKTSVLWPLPNERHRWSFQIDDDAFQERRRKSRLAMQVGAESYPHLTPEYLRELVRERAPWYEAPIGNLAWSVEVRFERRLTTTFGGGHAYLAGDAGHMAAPVGVQSMNAGLAEAHTLATRLGGVIHRTASYATLDAYAAEQLSTWKQLLASPNLPKVGEDAPPWAKEHARRLLGAIPASGNELAPLLGKLGLSL